MDIIPVIDVMGGLAVSGKAGEREKYRPLKTIFSGTPNPVKIALSLKNHGAKSIYIADLDSIEGKGSNLDSVGRVNHILPVILDSGVKNFETFKLGLKFAWKVVAATETLKSIEELERILRAYRRRAVISVDIRDSELYSQNLELSLEQFRDKLLELNPPEIILLDISSVGTARGFNRELLKIFRPFRDRIIPGGGIVPEDIPELKKAGVKGVLIGTALHRGRVPLR